MDGIGAVKDVTYPGLGPGLRFSWAEVRALPFDSWFSTLMMRGSHSQDLQPCWWLPSHLTGPETSSVWEGSCQSLFPPEHTGSVVRVALGVFGARVLLGSEATSNSWLLASQLCHTWPRCGLFGLFLCGKDVSCRDWKLVGGPPSLIFLFSFYQFINAKVFLSVIAC